MFISRDAEMECWVWFSVVITTVFVRYYSQYIVRKRNFLRNIPLEDILMAITVLIYTIAMVSLYLYFQIASKIDFDNITPQDEFLVGRRLGVLNILGETSIQTTLWCNKICLLLLYNRLT
ncbi:hypothetical protein LZ30DRAFT_738331 [Colletotrichum cereale]|nr:hypothetical protein LZ30DRAFT_738331 [Colletotrichum cereale]